MILLDVALAYAARGWSVFPVTWPVDGHCSCSKHSRGEVCASPAKHPLTQHGLKDATTDPETISAWWRRWPQANVGVRTGDPFDVIDCDGVEGMDAWVAWCGENGIDATAFPRSITGRGDGGRHILVAATGFGNTTNLLPHVDYRGVGGYIVAPPSLHVSGNRYAWKEEPNGHMPAAPPPLLALLGDPATTRLPATSGDVPGRGGSAWGRRALDDELRLLSTASEGERNHALNKRAFRLYQLVAGGELDETAVTTSLRSQALGVGLDASEVDRTLASARVGGMAQPRSNPNPRAIRRRTPPPPLRVLPDGGEVSEGPAPDAGSLPVVIGTARDLRHITDEAIAALEGANAPPSMFVRSGRLVRWRRDEDARPMVDDLGEAEMRGALTRAADWRRQTKDALVPIVPPREVVGDVLALGEWPGFPALVGVVEAPILRSDGSVLDQRGYDAATRLVHAPDPQMSVPPLPESPTAEDVAAAVAVVDDLIADFPFDGEASRANAIALLLTPIVRPAIRGCVPMALIDAPQAGSGKGKLASLVSIVASGREVSAMTAPKAEEEWRKQITSQLQGGPALIVVDNVEGDLHAPQLAAVLTTTSWQDRLLGQTRQLIFPARAVWVATGNNIHLRGDLPRRCYRIRIDAKTWRPWLREDWRHPELESFAKEHRGDLLAALLTMARAWYTAGKPAAKVPRLGSFEEWSTIVGGVLAHAGVPGFLANLEELYAESDQEEPQWCAFLEAWAEMWGGTPTTVAQVADELRLDGSRLRPVLPDELADALAKESTLVRRIGNALSKRVDKRFGSSGLRIGKAGVDHGAVQWRVLRDAAAPSLEGLEEF